MNMKISYWGASGLQVYKQKVKHMMYDHQNSLATLKADGELLVRQAMEQAAEREQELLKDKQALQQELREQAPYTFLLFVIHCPAEVL